jgi:tellurite resistance-related uncharacterized protein
MKECSKCKQQKPLTMFNKHKNGTTSWCKTCVQDGSKKYYNDKKEKLKEKRKIYYDSRRKWYNEYKQNLKCSLCDENHIACLEFHHTEPDKKDFNISEALGRLNLDKNKILEEINKCIVLCSNCHKKLHWNEKKIMDL